MNGDGKPDIRQLNPGELKEFLANLGEKPFRTNQVWEWLWKKGASGFQEMTSLPAETRKKLAENFRFNTARITHQQESRDGTVKTVFSLYDGILAEGVLIPSAGRTTACISSQAGCALGCKFCATGAMGFARNLTKGEIFDQALLLNRLALERTANPLSNIVYMGMGEPLMNYGEVSGSVERLTAPDGQGISPQRITVSTVGIPDRIRQLADDRIRPQLAVSLHAATNAKRDRIIPLNRKYPLEALSEALTYYHRVTRKRFTIEYVLLDDFNDSEADARALAAFCRDFPVKINLIEYNPVEGNRYLPSSESDLRSFAAFLEKRNLVVNIRKSRGREIQAACGQLAGTLKKGKK